MSNRGEVRKRRLLIILTLYFVCGSAISCMRTKITTGTRLPSEIDILVALNELKFVKETPTDFSLSGSGGDMDYFGNLRTRKPIGEIKLHELRTQIREQLVSLTPMGYIHEYHSSGPIEEVVYVDKNRNQLSIAYVSTFDESRILNITFRINFYSPSETSW
jgi:hypothetical protein